MTKWSPETRRRRAPRRGVRARVRKQLGGRAREKRQGRRGEGSPRGTRRPVRGLGAAGRRRGRRGSPASEAEDELGVLVVGAPVSNGLHHTQQRATAVLGDTLGRRGGYGGRVNDGERRRPRRAWGRKEWRGSGGRRERRRGREESGASGREAQGGGGAGALILPVAGEGVRRGRPLFRPRSGEQGRGGRPGEVG